MDLDRIFRNIADFLGTDTGLSTVQGLRELLDGYAELVNEDPPDVGELHESVPFKQADGHSLTVDVIKPPGAGPFPVLVYLHGGAWVWGSPKTHRKLTCRIAAEGFLTLSVDYRLAPEHPFPAGFHDCVHAVHFAARNAAQWGGDPQRLVLAGDSAGANLAAAVAIELSRSAGAPKVAGVGLLYGVFDFSGFEADGITALLAEAYLGETFSELAADPRVSPIVKASSLPPAHIAVGTADPLIEDAEALRSQLARAGKVHDYHVYEDMPHAFVQMEFLPDALPAIRRMTAFLHEAAD